MNLPKYSSVSLCMILCALAVPSFAADSTADKPAPAAVPAAEQADYAEKMAETTKAEAEAKAAAEKEKAEAEAKAADEKAKAEAKATAEEKKKAAEEKLATAFEKRFPELAQAIADADLSADKKAEVERRDRVAALDGLSEHLLGVDESEFLVTGHLFALSINSAPPS